jgi:hypothetical protein
MKKIAPAVLVASLARVDVASTDVSPPRNSSRSAAERSGAAPVVGIPVQGGGPIYWNRSRLGER